MAAENDDLKLDGDVASWEMNMAGGIKGTYIGLFKFRCYLTPLMQIAAGREQRALLGDNMALATEHESFLAYALTQLKYRIIVSPPFWATSGAGDVKGDLADEEVIEAVLDAAIRAELKYKDQLKKKKEEALERANAMVKAREERMKAELQVPEDAETLE